MSEDSVKLSISFPLPFFHVFDSTRSAVTKTCNRHVEVVGLKLALHTPFSGPEGAKFLLIT